ncbi:MAG TPA: STAS domain-containing protein [Pseudonocardiaceae bacterium]|nr:STAS domain-containing protein [Pseudonocardiaceae bacterium]
MSGDPHDTAGLYLAVHQVQDIPVVAVTGELDMATAPILEDDLVRRLADIPPTLVIDLTDVTFLSSAGLQVLMHAHTRQPSTHVAIVAPTGATLRPIQLTGLDRALALYPSLRHAVTPSPCRRPAVQATGTDSDLPHETGN